MLVDFVFSWLLGAVVGLRYRVMALLPIFALVVGLVFMRAVVSQTTVLSLLAATSVSLLGTQIGYLCGAAIRKIWRK